jgi:hypothetical protein
MPRKFGCGYAVGQDCILRGVVNAANVDGFPQRPGRNSGVMRRSNVALRLQSSLLEEAKRVAEKEGVA